MPLGPNAGAFVERSSHLVSTNTSNTTTAPQGGPIVFGAPDRIGSDRSQAILGAAPRSRCARTPKTRARFVERWSDSFGGALIAIAELCTTVQHSVTQISHSVIVMMASGSGI